MPSTKKTTAELAGKKEAALFLSLKAVNDSIQALQGLLAKGTATQKELESVKAEVDRLIDDHMKGMMSKDAEILPREKHQQLIKASKAMLKSQENLEQLIDLINLLDPNNKTMQKLAKEDPDVYIFILQDRDKSLSKSIAAYSSLTPQPEDYKAVAALCSKSSNLAKEKIALANLKVFNQLINKDLRKMGERERAEHAKALKEARQDAKSALTAFAGTVKSGDPKRRALQQMIKSFKTSEAACEKTLPRAATGSNRQRLAWQQSKQDHALKALQPKKPPPEFTFRPW